MRLDRMRAKAKKSGTKPAFELVLPKEFSGGSVSIEPSPTAGGARSTGITPTGRPPSGPAFKSNVSSDDAYDAAIAHQVRVFEKKYEDKRRATASASEALSILEL